MATNAIISASSLDISKVSFGDIRLNKAGGKSVPIKYNGQNLQIRIPEDTYPMGVNIKEGENGTTYMMSMTLKGCDPYAKERASSDAGVHGHIYNFLIDFQKKLLDTAETNSSKWFGKSRNRSVLEELMKQFISPSVEKVNGEWVATGKYPPSFRMKIPVYNGEVAMDVVNGEGKPVEVTPENLAQVFPKRFRASVVVSPSVYVSGQGFGVTWRVSFARVVPPQRLTAAQVFADEIQEEVKTATTTNVFDQAQQEETQIEEEHREEEQEIETPTAPPAPAPAVKNRRRVAVA
jgi:hypothetical protein